MEKLVGGDETLKVRAVLRNTVFKEKILMEIFY